MAARLYYQVLQGLAWVRTQVEYTIPSSLRGGLGRGAQRRIIARLFTLTPSPFLLRILLRRKVQGNHPWLPARRAIGPQDRSHFTGSPLKGEGVY